MAPDGEILCRVPRKKLDWYVAKGLGSKFLRDGIIFIAKVSDSPYQVRLNFEPKGMID